MVGITSIGQGTAELLGMNNDERIEMRAVLQGLGDM